MGQCPTWWPPCRIEVASSVQCHKVWLTPTTGVPCSNTANMRNPLKLAGMPETTGTNSAVSGLKFTIVGGHVEEILLLNKFFSDCWSCLSCEDIAGQICPMVPRWRFFASCIFSEPRAARFRRHLKFALRPHHVWKYDRQPVCDGWD